MAKVVNKRGNIIYAQAVDYTATTFTSIDSIVGIIVSPTGATALIEIRDNTAGGGASNILDLRVAAADDTHHFDFSQEPIVTPNGFILQTVTDCNVTIIVRSK